MGLRFRRSVKLMPGVRMNLSGSGASLSLGGRGAVINLSTRGTRATVGLPGTGLSYTTSVGASRPRRRSTQQLAAEHRRMLRERASAEAAAEVERIEAELSDTLGAWRELPSIPSDGDYRRQLTPAPFRNVDVSPGKPDVEGVRDRHELEVRQAVEADFPLNPWLGNLWVIVIAACLFAIGPVDVGVSVLIGSAAGLLTWGVVLGWWASRIRMISQQRHRDEWPACHRALEASHVQAVADYERRVASARGEWTTAEQRRVAELHKLLHGDLEAMGQAVTEAVEALDFPFDAQCAVAVDDDDHVLIDVDLPEIEDVVPETQLRALKDGSLSEKKRKASDRNQLYAELVCGIALVIAASAMAAGPTLRFVTVAGRTQRAKRGSGAVDDHYVYEVKLPREFFARFDAQKDDPVDACRRAGARIQVNANGSLRTIERPEWVDAVVMQ